MLRGWDECAGWVTRCSRSTMNDWNEISQKAIIRAGADPA